MKIIKNYNEVMYSIDNKKIIYQKEHENYNFFINHKSLDSPIHRMVLTVLPKGNSIWIDGFGYAMKIERIISFELRHNKEIFNGLDKKYKIHFAENFSTKNTMKTIEKIYQPSSFVFYFPPFLKYTSIEEYNNFLNLYYNFFLKRKIVILIDLKFIRFNKIRFTNREAIDYICNHIPQTHIRIQKIDNFKYMLEIN